VHFFVGGESLTAERAALIREVGAAVSTTYGLSEAGSVAVGCIEPAAPDDMHVLLNRVALVQTPRSSGGEKTLLLTALSPHAPKILLNVETGDTGVLAERPCGCSFGRIGFTTHLSNVTSYEKLTAEGVTFLASDVSAIVEQLLPAAFGGGPTDYQFVREITVDGLARLRLRVSPRLGIMDETQVLAVVRKELQRRSPQSARVWNDARVIQIERAEPLPTVMGKLFPLHVIESSR
jgi:phenylacetate-coenzyme A ligase PaaK-like adenylate-forming protein